MAQENKEPADNKSVRPKPPPMGNHQESGRRIRITYEIITPDSAKFGAPSETGWLNEEGIHIPYPTIEDLEEYGTMVNTVVQKAVDIIQQFGSVEPSCSVFMDHTDIWYSTIDPERNFESGSEKYYAFHLDAFYPHEKKEIYERITGRKSSVF